MGKRKIDKPEEVKQTFSIPKWQDEGLDDICKKENGSKVQHVRQALTDYIIKIMGASYVSRKKKEAEKK